MAISERTERHSLGIGVALIFLLVASAWGQDINAGIRGTVSDPSGAVVTGATVTATNVGTGYTRDVVTDSTGGYTFTLLPVGTYELAVTMAGFKKYTRTGILLSVNQVASVNVTLDIGSTTQQVDVKEAEVVVNTQTSEVGMLMEGQQIRELPLNGRNPIQLATLTNGVQARVITTYLGQDGGTLSDQIDGGGSVITVNGNRFHQTQFNLDGGEFAGVQYDSGLNYPNPDALQEFRFITQNYGADFGRLPGGVMNVITKSGTNQIHGSAFEFNRNSALATLGTGNVTKPFLNQNQFGFTAGGPVLKNKLFLFGTGQWLRIATSIVASGQLLPNALERTGDLSKDPTTGQPWPAGTHDIIDPSTNQPFPGNIIPANRFDPVAIQLLNLIPLPNMPDGTFYGQGSAPVHNHQYLIKSDYQINSKNQLAVSLFRDFTDGVQPFGRGGPGNGFAYVNTTGPNSQSNSGIITSLIGNDTHVFRSNLLNQFRFGYTRVRALNGQSGKVSPTMHDLSPNWPDFPLVDRPGIWISGRAFASRGSWGSSNSDDYQVMDKINYIRGGHNLKFGGELRHAQRYQGSYGNDQGVFWSGFPGSQTGDPLADFMLGYTFGIISSPSLYNFYQNSFAVYAQDDYKVSRRLVLNFGLRYQIAPYWTPTYEYVLADGTRTTGVATWNPGQQSVLFPNAPKGLVYANDPGIPASGSFTDLTNWTPRAGFGWDIFGTGKTALRGGFGLFDEMPGNRFTNGIGIPFGSNQLTQVIGPNAFGTWPGPGYYPAPPLDRNQSFASYLPFTSQYFDGLHPRNSMVYQYNLTLEQELSHGLVLNAAYVGNQGRRLPWNRNLNPAVYIPGTDPNTGLPLSTVGNTAERRVLNQGTPAGSPLIYGEIGVLEDSATSSYNALQVQVRAREYHGLTIQGNYTWSHNIDEQSTFFANLASNTTQNPNCLECDKGNSDIDRRHQLVLSYTYQIPSLPRALGLNNAVARGIFEGWEFSGVSSFSTGPYGSVSSLNGDNSLTGVGKDRADIIGDWQLPSGRSRAQKMEEYFNTAAFTENATGRYGTSRRNIIALPGSWGTDAAIIKLIPLKSDSRRLEFRCEFYNFFNHQNLGAPGLTVGAAGFGKILGQVGGQRFIQLGGKFFF
jgi:carboxypeptidase family protein